MKKYLITAILLSVICMSAGCADDANNSGSQSASDGTAEAASATTSAADITENGSDENDEEALLEASRKWLTIEDNVVTACSDKASGTVIIPDGVTAIGDNAFQECFAIKELIVPSSVEVVGSNAFNGCMKLSSIVFSEGLKELKNNAFNGCQYLGEVKLPDSLELLYPGVFGEKDLDIIYKGQTYTPQDVEALCKAVCYDENGFLVVDGDLLDVYDSTFDELVLPDHIDKICMAAFNGDEIGKLVIPGTVKEIEESAFFDCDWIDEITLEDGVTTLAANAFGMASYGTVVELIHLPASLTSVSEYALDNCQVCEYGGVEYEHYSMNEFGDDHLYELLSMLIPEYEDGMLIQDGVLADVLYCRDSLHQPLVIPEGVTVIGSGVHMFSECEFYEVQLPQTLTEIADEGFMHANFLESVEIPAGVKRIGDRAFRLCVALTTVVLNDDLEELGADAFEGCDNVSVIYKGNTYTQDNIDELYAAVNG